MANDFDKHLRGLESPATTGVAVTPSDSTDLADVARFFWVGTGGNVQVVGTDNVVVPFPNVQSGSYVWCGGKRINSTGTTASGITALR